LGLRYDFFGDGLSHFSRPVFGCPNKSQFDRFSGSRRPTKS
jgi:hypothetical protein